MSDSRASICSRAVRGGYTRRTSVSRSQPERRGEVQATDLRPRSNPTIGSAPGPVRDPLRPSRSRSAPSPARPPPIGPSARPTPGATAVSGSARGEAGPASLLPPTDPASSRKRRGRATGGRRHGLAARLQPGATGGVLLAGDTVVAPSIDYQPEPSTGTNRSAAASTIVTGISLADSSPRWSVRLAGRPHSAAVLQGVLVVEIVGDTDFEIAEKLSRWVDNARNAAGRFTLFDRGTYSPPDNFYDEAPRARPSSTTTSSSSVAEITEAEATFRGAPRAVRRRSARRRPALPWRRPASGRRRRRRRDC